ncbi:MAG: response regulator [Cytophagales bacterium]|nr:response regulator [Cytophagales bacterium]MDW8383386.1 response regulator [Flammeovirgaceae bacterium]
MKELHYKILTAGFFASEAEQLTHILKKLGKRYEVIALDKTDNIIEALEKNKPDVVVIEGKNNGLDYLRAIKRGNKIVPAIICLEQEATTDDIRDSYTAGASDYVKKPFDADEIQNRVKSAIRMHDLQKKILQQNQHIRAQSIAHARVKKRIFKSFLVYAVVAFLVSVISFLLFQEMERNERVITKVNDIHKMILLVSEHDQENFNKSTFFRSYFEVGQEFVYSSHNETIDSLNRLIAELENMSQTKKFDVQPDIVELKHTVDLYDGFFGESLMSFSYNPDKTERQFAQRYHDICRAAGKMQFQIDKIASKVQERKEQIVSRFRFLNVIIVTGSVILTLLLTISIKFVFSGNETEEISR